MARQKPKVYDRHHRKCRSNGGTNDARNISIVDQTQHRAYHCLFQNMTPEEVAKVLTKTWVDPDYIILAIRKDTLP
jgi:hypothetical protein